MKRTSFNSIQKLRRRYERLKEKNKSQTTGMSPSLLLEGSLFPARRLPPSLPLELLARLARGTTEVQVAVTLKPGGRGAEDCARGRVGEGVDDP